MANSIPENYFAQLKRSNPPRLNYPSYLQTFDRYLDLPRELQDQILEYVLVDQKGAWYKPWVPLENGIVLVAAHASKEMRAQMLPISYKTSKISIPHWKIEDWYAITQGLEAEKDLVRLIRHINLLQNEYECGCRRPIQIHVGQGWPNPLNWEVIEEELGFHSHSPSRLQFYKDSQYGLGDEDIQKEIEEEGRIVGEMYSKELENAKNNDPGEKVRAMRNMVTFDFGYGHFVNLDQRRNDNKSRNEIIRYIFEEQLRHDMRIKFQGRIVRDIRSAAPQVEINTDFANGNTLLVYAKELSHIMNREPYTWDCECGGFDYLKNTYIDRIELRPYGVT